jgi:MOSC domain-containing protein YiiM
MAHGSLIAGRDYPLFHGNPYMARSLIAAVRLGNEFSAEGRHCMETITELSARHARTGRLEWIGLRGRRGEILTPVQAAELICNRGLAGDHAAERSGRKRQITLIQWEHLTVIGALCATNAIAPERLRRNLAISGINLCALRNCRFRLGGVLLEGSGRCPPCSRMERELGHGGYNAMLGHGGISARVLTSGRIAIGATLTPVVSSAARMLEEY